MNIRKALKSDINQLIQLGKQIFIEHQKFNNFYYQIENDFYIHFEKWLKNTISDENKFLFVAEKEKKIAGFISGYMKRLYPWFRIKQVGHISFLYVRKDKRQRKIGKSLEKQASIWMNKKGAKYIELYVEEINYPAVYAWRSYGFYPFKKFLQKRIS